VLVFSLTEDRSAIRLERTGYRGKPGPQLFVTILPRHLHRGRMEDDLVYATDTAFYRRSTP
jgi:hypothetical protein